MDTLRTYLIRVIATAILCSTIQSLAEKTAFQKTIQLLLGAAMLIAILQPLSKWRLHDITLPIDGIMRQCEDIINEGITAAETTTASIITQEMRTYIVEKANQLGAQVIVEVELNACIPTGITIKGNVSPYIQSQLSAWLESEMGIPREAQQWI